MTQEEFHELKKGDLVSYPEFGSSTITHVERIYDFDHTPPRIYTWEIEVFGGQTIRDYETTVSKLQKVK